jgi:oligogalacturonide transport system substrate-binding protein
MLFSAGMLLFIKGGDNMKKSFPKVLSFMLAALMLLALPLSGLADVNLRFSWWGGDERHEATLKVIEMYEAQNPGVHIEGEYGGFDGYLEKMITQMAGNAAPDIMQIDYAYLQPFWGQMGNFVDFSKQTTVDISGFPQGLLAGVTAPTGEIIGLPTGLNYSIVYANKKLADAAGIELKQMSWDELLDNAKKLKAYDSEAYLAVGGVNRYIFEPYMFNITGQPLVNTDYTLGFDYEAARQAFEYVQKCYAEGVLVPLDVTVATGTYGPYQSPEWLDEKVMMILDFSSGEAAAKASKPEGQVVAIPSPGNPDAQNTGIVLRPTNMLAVNAKSQNAEEALKFVNFFFNNVDAIDTLGLVRSVPSTETALARMTEQGKLQADTKAVADWASSHKGGSGQNIISTNTTLETIENDILSGLYYGDYTVEQAAEQFVKLMTERVAELKQAAEKSN